MQTVSDPLIGSTLDDKYRLDRLLGIGGMGSVYQATHLLIERLVAVKVLNPRLVADTSAKERLRREARAAGRLRHSNAVAVTDFGETRNGIVYIVMELLEGSSLRDLLAEHHAIEPHIAVSIILQASSAVAAAHEVGIIHRDLKPGNIYLIERPGRTPFVKVLDFGIAKIARDIEGKEIQNLSTLTETGILIGTPRYMSPEQCDGRELTAASDVYSLAVMLYEMLTGSAPFNGASALAIAMQHSQQMPRPPRELNPELPEAIERVILHALEKNPEARPANAAAFARELSEAARLTNLDSDVVVAGNLELREDPLRTQKLSLDDRAQTARNRRPLNEVSGAPLPSSTQAGSTQAAAHAAAPSRSASTDFSGNETAGSVGVTQPLSGDATRVAKPRAVSGVENLLSLAQAKAHEVTANPKLLLGAVAIVGLVLLLSTTMLLKQSPAPSSSQATTGNTATRGNAQTKTVGSEDASIGRSIARTETGDAPKPDTAVELSREPTTAAEFYERAEYFYSINDFKSAARDLEKAIDLQPDFPAAHNRLGVTLMQDGQFAAATKEFRKAIDLRGGNFPIAQYNLGYALQKRNQHRDAIAAFEAAIANQPNYPDAYFQIGSSNLTLNRDRDAIAAFQKAIEQKGGNDYESYMRMGVAHARLKQFDEAEKSFRTAIEQSNNALPEAHYNLALLYEAADRREDAIREFETYLKQSPNAFNRRLVENSLKRLRRRG